MIHGDEGKINYRKTGGKSSVMKGNGKGHAIVFPGSKQSSDAGTKPYPLSNRSLNRRRV